MKQGDTVKGVGLAEVIRVSEWDNKVTVRITEHPDRSVVGREYSAPKSHFEVVELTDDMFAQEENRVKPEELPFDDKPHFIISGDVSQPISKSAYMRIDKDGVHVKGATVVKSEEGGGYTITGKTSGDTLADNLVKNGFMEPISLQEPKKPFWKRIFGGK